MCQNNQNKRAHPCGEEEVQWVSTKKVCVIDLSENENASVDLSGDENEENKENAVVDLSGDDASSDEESESDDESIVDSDVDLSDEAEDFERRVDTMEEGQEFRTGGYCQWFMGRYMKEVEVCTTCWSEECDQCPRDDDCELCLKTDCKCGDPNHQADIKVLKCTADDGWCTGQCSIQRCRECRLPRTPKFIDEDGDVAFADSDDNCRHMKFCKCK